MNQEMNGQHARDMEQSVALPVHNMNPENIQPNHSRIYEQENKKMHFM